MKSLLSKDEKTKLLETFRSSDQTQAAFAEVNGINLKTLARWIYQQRLEARQITPEQIEMLLCGIENQKKFNVLRKRKRSRKQLLYSDDD